ncbi:4Fe-4S dicluster domain-containing protein [Parasporobacterium paucivorans]|uniref:Fe-S-cluster-containing dehydrogenase component n=1 Tax=Parasporobacterium paucivorans DSM 15970 TaxID=1122934 RepID=A0A1M6DGB1_9FIRM|nr:4Fe-4S dicluster domain-containing protein [Parasporobacterium paucivorans]SHI72377.1 Fe-S-cluster-containing dehydrogenase component [Parasporobacterium paucivorans DSM 15970]
MEKWHIVVDIEKCVGCFNCMLACKDEHVGNKWLPYTDEQQKHENKWINPEKHERGSVPFTEICFVPHMCQHCDEAPCEKKFPDVVTKRPDGIVLLDVKKAKGKKELADACPYGAIVWNEELKTAQKCTLCAHLLDDGWTEPRCVQSCPLRALSIVHCEDTEFEKLADKQNLKPITNGSNQPRVLYKNLYKFNKVFVAGALAFLDGDIEKAAVDARISLSLNGKKLLEQKADFFGEFKFDKLPKNSGTFTVECLMEGYNPIRQEVTVGNECVKMELMTFEGR